MGMLTDETYKKVFAKDIMTKKVLTTSLEMSLLEVARIISEHNFNGLPVVDKENHVLGIVTEYDLIDKASEITVKTLKKALQDIHERTNGDKGFKHKAEEIYPLKVSDVMTKDPITVGPDTSIEDLMELFRKNQRVNPVPIVDKDRKLLGLVSRTDILRPFDIFRYASR